MGVRRRGQEGLTPYKIFLKSPSAPLEYPSDAHMCHAKSVANLALGLFGLNPILRFRIIMNGYLLAMYCANTDVK